ncbi:pyruvate kinase [Allorhodopirellula heiligendammensis]|uniref:Uncharacterized protein n=1 Tax=Allorhodopirellula heiligendammensis TaxID=2714739 RepID=A0A5C6BUU0_9BACT|nr:pyruvate kinase [Allorhodopirellula heiligendammensis]TWU16040.1 hypothetical protein Poly21_32450 [Allorhodopirellula heiligendammensis]
MRLTAIVGTHGFLSRIVPRSLALVILLQAICLPGFTGAAPAEQLETPGERRVNFQRKPLDLIPAGARFVEGPPTGWSNLLSFVEVQLTSGDATAVSETVRHYAELFNLVMLANTNQNAAGEFELDRVAIGFSMLIDGKNTVVTSDTQSDLGGGLSLIGRGVLDSNVASLARVEQVARTDNSILIDAPAVFLRDGEHREMVVRHYIWVFPENGNVGTLVWLLDPSPRSAPRPSQLHIVDRKMELLPPNMHEDRVMDVDADKFSVFGIPAKDAFASVRLPPGVTFEMNEAMQRTAGQQNFTAETFADLTTAIAQSLKAGRIAE